MGALSAIATPVLAAVAPPVRPSCSYERRAPEDSALHRAVRQGWPEVQAAIREQTGGKLPDYLHKAVKAYLACGQLANGFSRWQCPSCHKDMLVAFSCKVRGLCNSCDGKRMIEEAEHLTNSVLPKVPYRQWVLTLPFDLRYLAAWNVPLRNAILTAAMNAIHRQYEAQARARGIKGKVQSGAVVVTQRASSDLRLNLHFHILAADGVWAERNGQVEFRPASHFDTLVVQEVLHDITLRIDKQLIRLGFKEAEGEEFDGDDPSPFSPCRWHGSLAALDTGSPWRDFSRRRCSANHSTPKGCAVSATNGRRYGSCHGQMVQIVLNFTATPSMPTRVWVSASARTCIGWSSTSAARPSLDDA